MEIAMCDYLPKTVDPPENYHVDNPLRTVGQIVTVLCRNITVAVVRCMADLKWNATVPSCTSKDAGDNLGPLLIIVWVVSGVLLFSLFILIVLVVTSRSKACGSTRNDSPRTSVFHISGLGHRTNGRGGDNPGFSRADERCGEWSFHRTRPPTDSERPPSYHEAILNNYITAGNNSQQCQTGSQPTFVRAGAPPSYRTSQVENSLVNGGSETTNATSQQNTSQISNTGSNQGTVNQSNGNSQRTEDQNNDRVNNQNNDTIQRTNSQNNDTSQRTNSQNNDTSQTIERDRRDTNPRTGNQNMDTTQRNRNHDAGISSRNGNQNTDNNQRIDCQISATAQANENEGSQRDGNQKSDTHLEIGKVVAESGHIIENQSTKKIQRKTESSSKSEPRQSTNVTSSSRHHTNTRSDIAPMSRRYAESYPQCFFEDEPPPPYVTGSVNCSTYRSAASQSQQNIRERDHRYRQSLHSVPPLQQTNSEHNGNLLQRKAHFRQSMHECPTNTADSLSVTSNHRPHTSNISPHQNVNAFPNHSETAYNSKRNQEISHLLPNSNLPSSISNHPFPAISNIIQSPSTFNHISTISTNNNVGISSHNAESSQYLPSSSANSNALQTFPSESNVPNNNISAARQPFVSTVPIGGNRYRSINNQNMNHGQANQEMLYVTKGFQAPPFLLNSQPHGLSSLPHHIETQPLCTSTPINQSPATDRKLVQASHPSPIPIARNHLIKERLNREQLIFQRLRAAIEEGYTSSASQGQTSVPHYLSVLDSCQPYPSHYIHAAGQGCAPIARLDSEFL